MNTYVRTALAAAILSIATAAAPTHVAAQGYTTSVGWGGGWQSLKPFVDKGEHSPQEIALSSPWVLQLTAEDWHVARGLVGLRLGGSFARGSIAFPSAERTVSTWGLEAAALLRIMPHAASRTASAYLIGGGGLLWFGLGDGGTVPIAGTSVVYDAKDRRQPMVVGGAGIEFLTAMRALENRMGVRLEAVDQITFGGPFRPLAAEMSGTAHNLRISVMLFSAVPGLF